MMMNPVKIILQIITSIMRYDIVFKEELRWLSNSNMAYFTSEHSVRLAFVDAIIHNRLANERNSTCSSDEIGLDCDIVAWSVIRITIFQVLELKISRFDYYTFQSYQLHH